jgi:phosphonate transport system substrate-binding protein
MLRLQGLETVELSNVRQDVPMGKVGYAFTRGELNMVSWVSRGIADAGAFSNLDWEDSARTPENPKDALRVFHQGNPVMRSVLLVRSGLRPDLKVKLKRILFSMHADPDGKEVLQAYNAIKKFNAIGPEAAASLAEVRRLMSVIREKLNQ